MDHRSDTEPPDPRPWEAPTGGRGGVHTAPSSSDPIHAGPRAVPFTANPLGWGHWPKQKWTESYFLHLHLIGFSSTTISSSATLLQQ